MVSAFALEDGAVYQTYTTTWRGLKFIMGYYPILDRAPRGRVEGADDWQILDSPPRRIRAVLNRGNHLRPNISAPRLVTDRGTSVTSARPAALRGATPLPTR